jgi:hypothetical protein
VILIYGMGVMRGVMEETQKRAREVGEHGRSLAFGASLAQAFGAI